MSEQQGWAPNPADEQGRASGPAAQPTTTPADTTTADTAPADTTSPATAPVTPPGTTTAHLPAAPADLPAAPTDLPAAPAGLPAASSADLPVTAPPADLPVTAPPAGMSAAAPGHDSAAAPGHHAAAATPTHPVPHAWPTNLAASGSGTAPGAGDVQAGSARTWPAAQDPRPAADGTTQTWPASQHTAPQATYPYTAAQGNAFTGEGGHHASPGRDLPTAQGSAFTGQGGFHAALGHDRPAAQAGHGPQHPGTGQDPRVWAAGAGQHQPHLPTAQLPPHVPHMQRPPQWAQQPQPGSVFVAPAVRRRSRVGLAVAGIVAAVGLSAVSAFGGGLAALELRPDKSNSVVSATNSSGSGTSATTTLSDVAAQVLPSVVSISTGNAVGSGVVITDDGAILTNNHVVATARGTTVQVTFSSGQSAQAKIVGTEPSSDLAVIKIVGSGTYTPLAFGDSSTVKVGDTVLAVGSPLGLDGSVTAGIVSAINRTIDEGEDGQSSAAKISGAIQTDAAINPGNSGGALVNTAGQLVGINTAIATSGQTAGNIGVGFAISSNTAKTVAQRLLS
ncbi:trypsin-like peptidase domain-containing protein [Dactylosporangium sp. NPDC049525]|uniref:trypsin-like peptidase domain-containing protein n=1 Tax=Dactylosporangium sp. NPDC049525 TaxID=3154730 RepID=UPI0034160624